MSIDTYGFTPHQKKLVDVLLDVAIREDIGSGDHTSLACIPPSSMGRCRLLIKADGVLSGMQVARYIFNRIDPEIIFTPILEDGQEISIGQEAFYVEGKSQSLLQAERLVLNCMQRMSGIATYTRGLVNKIVHTRCALLDTRKTTPGFRVFEKLAVQHGGAKNHRMGLYDMIMIKDNHVDMAGGIENAINRVRDYLTAQNLELDIEVEARTLADVEIIVAQDGIKRIMFDNFSPSMIVEALKITQPHPIETEASGGINENTLVAYAETGVDFISVGALTHQVRSLDLSLKAF
jgi:nicotinate-nucleotide pyrophosphorylase (carboxylating)